ncbi:MAG: cysteine--tRNA ligase [Chloroflexi bacterium]|nr:MAG: cysteine--tRNA ligase [Chloroflexota bacterium]PIE80783.1 MAG: cysteine--tRNA ligase [Chloroflexota bacterium]
MTLKIYNVLTRTKEEFKPLTPGKVNMYVCGPTVYDYSHIGHGKTYIGFDVVVRYLRYSGYDVLYVQNITDVGHMLDTGEDRILKKARQLSAGPMQVVETYMRNYFEDMDALGVQRPDISPRASGHITEQIEMVQTLIEKGHAYEVNGSVYFDVTSFPEYGKLSGRVVEELEEGARIGIRTEKRHAADFAIWKKAEPDHILRWPSPWGDGFPGWHVECSAMANKYLGQTFDIHGGGIDNIFPHNECEIAQSEAAHGEDFARYWMLTGSLTLDGTKMSKSLGNMLTIKDALATYRPEAIRAFMLSSHYSSPIEFSDDAIEAAHKGWLRLWGAVSLVREQLRTAAEGQAEPAVLTLLAETKRSFIEKMDDDFNAPAALAVLQELTRQVNTLVNEKGPHTAGTLTAIDNLYRELGGEVLGIVPEQADASANAAREDGLIRLLIDLRAQARAQKDWTTSDQIRDQLKALGIVLEDRADGTIWKLE